MSGGGGQEIVGAQQDVVHVTVFSGGVRGRGMDMDDEPVGARYC